MDIPINVDVYCQGEICGHTVAVVLNPVTDVITHIVIKEKDRPHTRRLVPIGMVQESTPHSVRLNCSVTGLHSLELFTEVEYIQSTVPHYVSAYMLPFAVSEEEVTTVTYLRIPPDELSVRRGTQVYTADGHPIGKVDEFLVNQGDGHISHLILRERDLRGGKDVTIPVSEIDRIEDDCVWLKLDKKQVGKLPAIPVRRK